MGITYKGKYYPAHYTEMVCGMPTIAVYEMTDAINCKRTFGQIAFNEGRWFVLNGFDGLLPFKLKLHFTKKRSLNIISNRLNQVEGDQ